MPAVYASPSPSIRRRTPSLPSGTFGGADSRRPQTVSGDLMASSSDCELVHGGLFDGLGAPPAEVAASRAVSAAGMIRREALAGSVNVAAPGWVALALWA